MKNEYGSQKLWGPAAVLLQATALWSFTVPYRRHVINPLNLWAPNACLKERKDLIWVLTPRVDFLAILDMRFFLQRLVRLLGRNGNQKTWAWLKEETGKGWCNCKFFHGVWEDKNVLWEVEGRRISF